jgi:tetratricopeptide (TPR) repeat protein
MPTAAAADPRLRYRALEGAGGILYWSGDYRAAYRTYSESLEVARQMGDRALEAQALYNRAFTGEGDDPFLLMQTEGREASEQALAIWRELGDRRGIAQALWALGSAHQFGGELERARTEYLEALDVFREFGDRYYIGWTTVELGWISAREEDWPTSTRYLAEGLEAFAAVGDVSAAPLILTSLAWAAYNIGDLEEGFRLAGAAKRLEREHGVGLTGVTSEFADIPSIPELIEKHPDQRPHFEAGEQLDFRAAIAEALAWAATRSAAGAADRAPETPPPAR